MSGLARQLAAACLLLVAGVLLAGCGIGGKEPAKHAAKAPGAAASGGAGSTLVLKGATVDPKTGRRGTEPAASSTTAAAKVPVKSSVVVGVVKLDPPKLNADGTIAGTDPFGSDVVSVQPTPIEDDPNANAAAASFARKLKDYDLTEWNGWVQAGASLPGSSGADTITPSLVTLAVERCGGARTVAAGVVLGTETVVTTVTAVDNADQRVWVAPARGAGSGTSVQRIPAMIQYLDVDDDIAVLRVPGLKQPALATHVPSGADPVRAYAYGLSAGGRTGRPQRIPIFAAMVESSLSKEQPDGFDRNITGRSVYPLVGAIDTGFTGGVVAATNDAKLTTGWGFHGLIRARIPYRAEGGGVAVPSRLVRIAIAEAAKLDQWSEVMPDHCPEWTR